MGPLRSAPSTNNPSLLASAEAFGFTSRARLRPTRGTSRRRRGLPKSIRTGSSFWQHGHVPCDEPPSILLLHERFGREEGPCPVLAPHDHALVAAGGAATNRATAVVATKRPSFTPSRRMFMIASGTRGLPKSIAASNRPPVGEPHTPSPQTSPPPG